jgi:hypothetical protein
MTLYKWLVLMGGVFLLVGIITAFVSSNYNATLMGEAQKGVAVLAPDPNSPEWLEKERLLRLVNRWFYAGLALTALGVGLQAIGSILPLTK